MISALLAYSDSDSEEEAQRVSSSKVDHLSSFKTENGRRQFIVSSVLEDDKEEMQEPPRKKLRSAPENIYSDDITENDMRFDEGDTNKKWKYDEVLPQKEINSVKQDINSESHTPKACCSNQAIII